MTDTAPTSGPAPRPRPSPRPRDETTGDTPVVEPDDGAASDDGAAAGEGAASDEGAGVATDAAGDPDVDSSSGHDTPGGTGARWGRPSRRATLLAALAGVAVLLAAAATWFAIESWMLRAGDPEENAALVDAHATSAVKEDVSEALKAVFSYNHANLDRTRRAAKRVLLDKAQHQYEAEFGDVAESARDRKVVRTASVRAVGVRSLRDGTATVLAFVDQQTLLKGSGKRGQNTIFLKVTAKKQGDSWKIARFGEQ